MIPVDRAELLLNYDLLADWSNGTNGSSLDSTAAGSLSLWFWPLQRTSFDAQRIFW